LQHRDLDSALHALRSKMRQRRKALPVRERLDAAAALAASLLPALEGRSGFVAGYWAVHGELPLHAVQANLPATLRWCLPVLGSGRTLAFREWRAGQPLATNRFGIPEPAEGPLIAADALAVTLLPLLAFDGRGHRLGQGGGWYDRSFALRAESAPPPLLVGVGYAWQQVEAIDAAAWDVPLDAAATDAGIVHFDRAPRASG